MYLHEMQTSCLTRYIIYRMSFGEDNIDLAKIILHRIHRRVKLLNVNTYSSIIVIGSNFVIHLYKRNFVITKICKICKILIYASKYIFYILIIHINVTFLITLIVSREKM
ncbi:hypothetical protein V1477_011282 [Vespula maculifrons]|uniref:Uncharacterized protein n=1 Tax=Vespula maculifrons TaxID=7453 RepID=A0ABD2C6A0_VESMC